MHLRYVYDGYSLRALLVFLRSRCHKFTGKERDSESGLDNFGARYYSNRFGRWLSADWSSVPVAIPYANLSNPQTLNLYSMVADDPESFADLDGHDGWDVAWGVLNSLASNFVSTQRVENGNSDVKAGQALGDALSVTVGGAVAITTVVGGVVADAYSGGAALVLSPAEAVVATTAASGALQGGKNLLKSALEKSSSDSSATEKKPHGNTAGDQPAELYEKYDKNGNFEKHGVSQDANKRYSKKELDGGTVKVTDRGPRKEMLQKERQKVETNPGPKNKEPWAGKKKDSNQQP
jgi:RHS repeat-associated protein